MTESDFQDSVQEKDNMIATRVYLPSTLDHYADSLAQSIGCSKSELLRHAIFHGLSVYAERSNKYKVNAKI
jgi:hypothetical protein